MTTGARSKAGHRHRARSARPRSGALATGDAADTRTASVTQRAAANTSHHSVAHQLTPPPARPGRHSHASHHAGKARSAAAAIIDRLVHHAEVVALKGDSYRLKNRDLGRAPGPTDD
jgi:hypothetical protein